MMGIGFRIIDDMVLQLVQDRDISFDENDGSVWVVTHAISQSSSYVFRRAPIKIPPAVPLFHQKGIP